MPRRPRPHRRPLRRPPAARLLRLVARRAAARRRPVGRRRRAGRPPIPPPRGREQRVSETSEGQARSSRRGASATAARTRGAASPRTGARRTVMYYIKQLPNYLRLLGGLLTDRRVSALDKLLVAGAIAYIA